MSDALHAALTKRFVDRRTSVLLRRLKQKEALLAEVNDKGEVSVEGEFVGRLEGFRFSPDKAEAGAEAKAVKSAALQALAPHFHLRADRFYNAPDTEIDFTDQGGLMWGTEAVGKLVTGAEPLKPQVDVFVDDVAGPDVAQKVQRRLQHFIDRKVAALFEPLLALQRDEALTGLARGFAFRLVENLGILPRAQVADDVKALDQDSRGALRKHGVRFGQFTIFMPLLLKPAPTRLRLLLWALARDLQEFPEAPPPGMVTVPTNETAPEGYDAMCGYRSAGARAIRIDMLERLADLLRNHDSRGGFEANPDMLSITGMTLEQFADLMQGLGYRAERGERAKVRAAPEAADSKDQGKEKAPESASGEDKAGEAASVETAPVEAAVTAEDAPADEAPATSAPVDEASVPDEVTGSDEAAVAEDAEAKKEVSEEPPEMEVFFTFVWGRTARPRQGEGRGRSQGRSQGGAQGKSQGKPQGKQGGRPQRGGKPGGKGTGPRSDKGGRTYQAKPPRKEKAIDPDNPFAAALMGLKDKT